MEVKSTGDDAWVTASGEQVTRYWGLYRQVLVTNYRDFVLVGQDPAGQRVKLETYRLAPSYLERPLLGRPLTTDEAREAANMVRCLAAIVFMEPLLDANYRSLKISCYPLLNM